MQAPVFTWKMQSLLSGRPSVGALLDLGEECYRHLMSIAPGLKTMRGLSRSRLADDIDLYLEVREQTAYTSLVHLTHYFPDHPQRTPDPDVVLRVYHDAGQVEVLSLRQSALPLAREPGGATLEQKWKVSLFIARWLAFCRRQGHRFDGGDTLLDDDIRELVFS